jgi:hypothetical protein
MLDPLRKRVRIVKSAEFPEAEIRRWREPTERKGRDNRPGFYSITGAFIELPERSEANSNDSTR